MGRRDPREKNCREVSRGQKIFALSDEKGEGGCRNLGKGKRLLAKKCATRKERQKILTLAEQEERGKSLRSRRRGL